MSRVDVTLRLCWGQTEYRGRPVKVKCSGVCDSWDMEERGRGVFWGKLRVGEEEMEDN